MTLELRPQRNDGLGEDMVWIPLAVGLCEPWGFRGTSKRSRESAHIFMKVHSGGLKGLPLETQSLLPSPGVTPIWMPGRLWQDTEHP